MEKPESIIETVDNNPVILGLIHTLEEKGFLERIKDDFSPRSYKIMKKNIFTAYENNNSLINTIAMGVSVYEDFLDESTKSFMMGGHFTASYCSENALKKWKRELKNIFPTDYLKISRICLTLGRYLCVRKALTRIYITI